MNDKYLSKYSNGKEISAAQYITEIICERKATKDKSDLHYRFWLQKKWSVFYRDQIASAHKLIKKYPSKSIIRALNSDEGRKIYSLRAPHLPAMIEKHSAILDQQSNTLTKNIERKDNVSFKQTDGIIKKNIISKLKELDNES